MYCTRDYPYIPCNSLSLSDIYIRILFMCFHGFSFLFISLVSVSKLFDNISWKWNEATDDWLLLYVTSYPMVVVSNAIYIWLHPFDISSVKHERNDCGRDKLKRKKNLITTLAKDHRTYISATACWPVIFPVKSFSTHRRWQNKSFRMICTLLTRLIRTH